MPRAYSDRTFSSNPVNRVRCFSISRGSNSPFRSRGVASSISPKSPLGLLLVLPLQALPLVFAVISPLA